MSRKLVVGCGYLGSRVARKWADAGDDVFALTRSEETAERFRGNGWTPIVGDVTEPDSLKDLPEVETVLYAVGFDRSSGKSQREIYVGGLQNLLHAMTGRCRRFLYISSTSVYGEQAGEWIDENTPAEPISQSGQVCRDAEWLVEREFEAGKGTILRLSGIYGPGRLFRRVSDLKAGKPISGEPEGWLNVIHVEDAVTAVLAGESHRPAIDVCLVSDDEPVTRRSYYTAMAESIGVALPPFDSEAQPRHARGLGKRCRNRRLREVLGVDLRFPTVREGIPAALGAESAE